MTSEERTWAIVAHLAPIVGYALGVGQILIPLGIYLFGPQAPVVKEEAREALNAQITFTCYGIGIGLLILTIIGIFLIPLAVAVLSILVLWTSIQGAIGVSNGRPYRYPFIFRVF